MVPRQVAAARPRLRQLDNRPRRRAGHIRGISLHGAPHAEPGPAALPLVHAYENGLGWFVRQRCRTRDDAEDALQDTMVAALRSSSTFRGESCFGTWLHAVAANACRRLYRRRIHDPHPADIMSLEAVAFARAPSVLPTALCSDPGTPERHLLRAELAGRIADALARLPEHYRTVVLLRDRDGWSSHATAAALRLSGPAMKSRLHRARMLLRRALAGYVQP